MKSIFERVIARGAYDLNGILKRIDEYHVEGKLSDDERVHLIAAARGDASVPMNAAEEIQRLWAAVNELRAEVAEIAGEIEDGVDAEDVPEYSQPVGAHDAYYNGAVVKYGGMMYMCVAPDGVACVWTPDAMPDYWEALE